MWFDLRQYKLDISLQHYNPVIDETLRELIDLPEDWMMLAQMLFGKILKNRLRKRRSIFVKKSRCLSKYITGFSRAGPGGQN
jgi:predicted oxidoreductase (fatty acid repression mutant protein)